MFPLIGQGDQVLRRHVQFFAWHQLWFRRPASPHGDDAGIVEDFTAFLAAEDAGHMGAGRCLAYPFAGPYHRDGGLGHDVQVARRLKAKVGTGIGHPLAQDEIGESESLHVAYDRPQE